MKLQLTAALLIGALSTVVSAQEEEKKDTPPPAAKKEAPQKRQPAPAAKQPQRPKQTFLGVGTAPIDPSLRDHLELDPGFGVVVRMVAPDSPAADAELKKGDVLTQIDDQKLTSHEHLSILVKSKSKGDIVDISLIRKGQKKTVTAELGEVTAPQHPHVLRRELTPQQLQPYRSMPSNQRGAWEAQRRGHSPVPFPKFENQSPEEWREAIKKYQDNLRGWMKENHAQRNSSTPEQGRRGGDKPPALSVRPGFPVRVMTDNSTIMISNEKGEVTITKKAGDKHWIKLENTEGETLYDGEYDAQKGLSSLPPKAQKHLKEMKLDDLKILNKNQRQAAPAQRAKPTKKESDVF